MTVARFQLTRLRTMPAIARRPAPTPNSASTQLRILVWVQPMARSVPASRRRWRM